MKEWLEEKDLPRDCASCRYYGMNCADGYSCSKLNGREVHCNFSEGMGYRHKDCPLQSITDHDKQVRKEVVQEIKALMREHKGVMFGRYNHQTAQHDEVEIFELGDLNKVLNKIIGE